MIAISGAPRRVFRRARPGHMHFRPVLGRPAPSVGSVRADGARRRGRGARDAGRCGDGREPEFTDAFHLLH